MSVHKQSIQQTRMSRHSMTLAWFVCGLAALFYCYEYLLRIQQSVMMPQLMAYFHASAEQIGILSAMYYYAYTPLQLVVAVLTDYYGSRKMLLFALFNCVVGCFIFAKSHFLWQADTGRLLIGLGSAFAFVATLRLAAMWLPKRYFALFVGLTTSLGMLGAMGGDIGMSWAVERFGWLSVIYIGMGVGLCLVPLFYLFVHENTVTTIHEESRLGWRFYAAGLLKALMQRQILLLGVIGCSMYFSLSVFADMWGIAYIQQLAHLSKVHAASLNALVYLGWLLGAPLHGYCSNFVKDTRWYLCINCLLAASVFFFLLMMAHSVAAISAALFGFGFFASAEVICFVLARDSLPRELTATAIGVLNAWVMLGGLIVLPLIGKSLDQHWTGSIKQGIHVYSVSGYTHAFLGVLCMLLLSAMVTLCLKPHDTSQQHQLKEVT